MERLRTRHVALGLCIAIGLTACGSDDEPGSNAGNHNGAIDHSIEVIDGRRYDCLTYTTVNRSRIDCERIPDTRRDYATINPKHNSSIALSTGVQGGRTYDCFAY